jgi:hypothetical protein
MTNNFKKINDQSMREIKTKDVKKYILKDSETYSHVCY